MTRHRHWRTASPIAGIVALAVLAGPVASVGAQTVVIRRADIERAGWNRVTELLDGAVGWARASVDGFTYAASPDHLPAAGESGPSMPEWIVVVDGQRVQTEVFGVHLLELLPISVGQIDSVVLTRGPVIYGGAPAARGVMSIFSRRQRPGIGGEITYQHGDETGDPGPYRYTDLSSPNVEKIGPFAHGDVGWRGGAWDVDAGVHVASLNVTDTLISSRFPGTTFSHLRQDVLSVTPTLRAGVDAFGGRHEMLASYGDQRGLLFIPTRRAEQSLRTTSAYVGVGGSSRIADSTTLSYEGSVTTLTAGDLLSPLGFTVGHTRRHFGGTVSAARAFGRATLTAGAIGDGWTLASDAIAQSVSSSGGGPFVRALLPIGSAVTVDARATLIFDGPRAGAPDASIEASFRLDSLTSFAVRGSRVQAHPNMDGSWIDAFVLDYDRPARAPALSAVGVTLGRRFLSHARATIDLRGEAVADWTGLGRATAPQFETRPDSVPHAGNLIGAHAHIETLGESVWQGSIDYDRVATFDLDSRSFGAEIASAPTDEFRAQLSASPVRDFRLSGIVDLAGGTSWPAFGATAGSPAMVPPLRRVDASMEKWLWRRRLRVELLYRNLLNEPDRSHPFGAQWNMRWHVSGSLVL